MSTLQKSIDINAPVTSVYNQWTQFEEFPAFMEGVKEVRQMDDAHLHWCAEIAGKDVEWDAEPGLPSSRRRPGTIQGIP